MAHFGLPIFYAYSDGSFTLRDNSGPNSDSTAYRVIGGIGTRQFGLFSASFYFGHQGSEQSRAAGGDVYGGPDLLAYADLGVPIYEHRIQCTAGELQARSLHDERIAQILGLAKRNTAAPDSTCRSMVRVQRSLGPIVEAMQGLRGRRVIAAGVAEVAAMRRSEHPRQLAYFGVVPDAHYRAGKHTAFRHHERWQRHCAQVDCGPRARVGFLLARRWWRASLRSRS